MILREIKNMYIKNRLTEGVDYVRYEWLKGDGIAYIDTKITDIRQSEIKVKFDDTDKVTNGSRVFGSETAKNMNRLAVTKINNNWSVFDGGTGRKIVDEGIVVTLDFNAVAETLAVNGSIKDYYPTSSILLDTILLFAQHRREYSSSPVFAAGNSKVSISYFEIENQINLVPCQLLKSIPSSLDANNRVRSAGECGMYDSISGKFYGNVANSGTFTVEGDVTPETHTGLQQIYKNKLIEGEDYETYDWLKADIPIGIKLMSLPINSKNFEFKRNFIRLMNSGYFYVLGSNNQYSYYIVDFGTAYPTTYKPQIWNNTTLKDVYASSSNIGLGVHTIIANDDEVTISSTTNTASLPWYGEPISISFNNASNLNKNTTHLTSSIKVDGVTRYVPCTLLHPIPRNLDAQCKARFAGECGMIDLISGKFYGNVASSGTFTVENDNNE